MKPIRVAIVCDYLEEGWPSMDLTGEMILTHLRSHASDRVEATRICPTFRPRLTRVPHLGQRRAAFNVDRLINRYREYPLELKRLQRQHEFDVFHIVDHSYAQLVHNLPAGRSVVTCHDLDTFRCLLEPLVEPRPSWFRALTKRTLTGLQKAAAIACDSDATRLALIEKNLVPAGRLETIYLGTHPECSTERHPEADADADRLLGAKTAPDQVEILHVGSNIPRKRIDVLLATFAGIRAQRPGARLIKVGGALTAEQSRQAEELGILPAIRFLPFFCPRRASDRATLAALYRRADLMLQPSEAEGFGLPIAEAIGCGTPMIASDIPVLREVGEDVAVYCPVGDVNAWVDASMRVLSQPDRRHFWRGRSERLRRKYRWEHHVSMLVNLYERIER